MKRERIVSRALRPFAKQGYAGTTCEQIADAADVSPATFYRYFPAKEDVVLRDDYDPMLAAAIESRPPGEHPVEAVLGSITGVLALVDPQESEVIRERTRLILRTPPLRTRMIEQGQETIGRPADAFARSLTALREMVCDPRGRL